MRVTDTNRLRSRRFVLANATAELLLCRIHDDVPRCVLLYLLTAMDEAMQME